MRQPRAKYRRTAVGAAALAAALALTGGLSAADWPQFQGPDRSGISAETGLARAWPAGGPRAVWAIDVGKGWAGPVVRDGEVYLLDRLDERREILRVFGLGDGKERWRVAFDSSGKLFSHPGSRGVPTVGENRVYAVGTFGRVVCVDRKTHKLVWSRHLVEDFPGVGPDSLYGGSRKHDPEAHKPAAAAWGCTQFPLVHKGTVIVAPMTDTVGVVAFDAATGKLRWKSPYVGRPWFGQASPYLTRLHGVDQIVTIANRHPPGMPPAVISGVDAASGKLLWQTVTWRSYKIPIPQPVRIAPDTLFVTGGYGIGCFSLRVTRDGGRWAAAFGFRNNNVASHIHNPVFYKGHLYSPSLNRYFVPNRNGLVCLDTAGRTVWKTGSKLALHDGGMIIADGLIYAMDGRSGELHLIEAAPAGYRPLAKAKVLAAKSKTAWAPLALSGGKLLVRDTQQLKCLDVGKP